MRKTKLVMDLPNVGDRRRHLTMEGDIEECIVTYVNPVHGWYQVVFPKQNVKECYKPPTYDPTILKHTAYGHRPIICIETGWVYASGYDCAEDMGLIRANIVQQINGNQSHCGGYHFTYAE